MITRIQLREYERGIWELQPGRDDVARLARLVRLAIAADEMLHSPRTAQQAALRDALREEGLR